eukprot:382081-Hanusia_phi.AAC.1
MASVNTPVICSMQFRPVTETVWQLSCTKFFTNSRSFKEKMRITTPAACGPPPKVSAFKHAADGNGRRY